MPPFDREERRAAVQRQVRGRPSPSHFRTRTQPTPLVGERRSNVNQSRSSGCTERRIPTATTAKTPRRKSMTRDEDLALAVDLAVRRELVLDESACPTPTSGEPKGSGFLLTLRFT
jgi:hypothetical protein